MVPVIEPELALFEVEVELVGRNTVELGQTAFSVAPEALDAVNVTLATSELISAMEDPVVVVAVENQTIIRPPTVGVDRGPFEDMPLDHREKLLPAAVLHNVHADLAAALEHAEDRCLARCSASALASHTPGPEVRLIHLELAALLRLFHGILGDALAEQVVVPVHGLRIEFQDGSCFHRGKILSEALQDFSDPVGRELGVPERHRRILEEILLGKSQKF